ncbi:MAG: hypothetical protein ABJJ14_20040, partial [Cyclobacteriaceae bacterium]
MSEDFVDKQIEGIVDEVRYSSKGSCTVTIEGVNIYLGYYSTCLKKNINVGDSIFKRSNSWELKLFRKRREMEL